MNSLLKHLELSQKILLHNNKRGIYFGYFFSSKLDKDYNIEELKSSISIYNNWKNRWCKRRICNLIEKNNIKKTLDLYTLNHFKNCIKYELPKIQEKIITDNLIKEILTYKSKPFSQEEICKILNKKYNIEMLKSDISRIYSGKIIPKVIDDEYNLLMSVKTSKKKITDEQIYFILDYYKNKKNFIKDKPPSYSIIIDKFKDKYNKDITKASVSDIIYNKLKPTIEKKEIKKINYEEKFKLLTQDQLKIIIKMKKDKTTQDTSDYIKENFNIYIKRNFISKLWNGEIFDLPQEILNSEEYQNMKLNKKQRTVKSKKFSKEELDWVLDNNLDKSFGERCMLFQKQFNKTITKTYISKLQKNKMNTKKSYY